MNQFQVNLSNNLTWKNTEDELDTLNKCLIHLHELPTDTDIIVKNMLLTLVRDRCVKLHEMRIKLNQGK